MEVKFTLVFPPSSPPTGKRAEPKVSIVNVKLDGDSKRCSDLSSLILLAAEDHLKPLEVR